MARGPVLPGRSGQTKRATHDESSPSIWLMLGQLAGVGWFVAISIAGGAIGGYFLDRWLNSSPWITVSGAFLGTAVAFAGMIRLLGRVSRSRPGK